MLSILNHELHRNTASAPTSIAALVALPLARIANCRKKPHSFFAAPILSRMSDDDIGISDRLHERLNRNLFPGLVDEAGQGGFSTPGQDQKASPLVSPQSPFLDLTFSYHNVATNTDSATTHQGGSRFGSLSAPPTVTPSVHNRYASYRLFGPKRPSPPPRRIAGSHFPEPTSKCLHFCMIARA